MLTITLLFYSLENKDNPRWYIFYCRSRSEKKVFDLLTKSDFNAFLPIIKVMRQWSDRKKMVLVPMLPGYMFVYCLHANIYNVVQTDNIVAPVKIAGKNLFLRDYELDFLKKIEENDLFDSASSSSKRFSKGDKVIVIDGPLKGFEGECIREEGKNYLQIQIESIGQCIKAKINESNLQVKT